MARPIDTTRREATLAKATDYVLEHGLAELSLRPLAGALGTSTRMLLYDFASKEALVDAVLVEVRRRLRQALVDYLNDADPAPEQLLWTIWAWLTDPHRTPYLRLFFHVHVDAMHHPDAYGDQGRPLVTDWLDVLQSGPFTGRFAPTDTSLIVATIRGLLLDRLTTGDHERTDRAMRRFGELVATSAGDHG